MPKNVILHGDCRSVLRTFESDTFGSLVTYPPAGINFMGNKWDSYGAGLKAFQDFLVEVFTEVIRVMKPGALGLVWSLPRTSGHVQVALEQAGFELRDGITHFDDKSEQAKAFLLTLSDDQLELLLRLPQNDPFLLHIFGQGRPSGTDLRKAVEAAKAGNPEAWKEWNTTLKPAAEIWWISPQAPLGYPR